MAAFAIVNGKKYGVRTRCRTEDGAIRRLLKRLADEFGCFEVHCVYCRREPCEIDAEFLMSCREL